MKSEKKLVFWGTGNVVKEQLTNSIVQLPDFYLDSDREKSGKELNGRIIKNPDEVDNWEELFIVLAMDNSSTVEQFLTELGLTKGRDFEGYRDWLFDADIAELEYEAEKFLRYIAENSNRYLEKSLIFSDCLAFDKGVCKYIDEWEKRENGHILLSEAFFVDKNAARKKLDIPIVFLPKLLIHNMYLKMGNEIPVDKDIVIHIQNTDYLRKASMNLRMGYPDMAENYEYFVCYWAEKIVEKILCDWRPRELILWNAFYGFHRIVSKICEKHGINVRYMEFGNIPGTIIVEETGQMGESVPARNPEVLSTMDVTTAEMEDAEKLLDELFRSRVNRNIQPKNNKLDAVKQRLIQDRPVVLYAGQNDNASGLQPYTENSRMFHSPIFKTSDEAAVYLAKLCEKNHWNFIYKPHPMMFKWCDVNQFSDDVIVVNDVDINDLIDLADMVITILSTVSYIALIRKKPVVMLGYTQLKGQGCTYEAFDLDSVESQLIKALQNADEYEKRANLSRHFARIKKYYF